MGDMVMMLLLLMMDVAPAVLYPRIPHSGVKPAVQNETQLHRYFCHRTVQSPALTCRLLSSDSIGTICTSTFSSSSCTQDRAVDGQSLLLLLVSLLLLLLLLLMVVLSARSNASASSGQSNTAELLSTSMRASQRPTSLVMTSRACSPNTKSTTGLRCERGGAAGEEGWM
jgi:hypothetical protein